MKGIAFFRFLPLPDFGTLELIGNRGVLELTYVILVWAVDQDSVDILDLVRDRGGLGLFSALSCNAFLYSWYTALILGSSHS